jgi:phospholipid-binding lipoprotein MlaA
VKILWKTNSALLIGFLIVLSFNVAYGVSDEDMPDDIDVDDTTSNVKFDDRLEKINREIFAFNKGVDKIGIRPATKVYRKITFSEWGRQRVSDALNNLDEPNRMINSIFYANPAGFFKSGVRFLINSTIGVLGLFDVAEKLGVKRNDISFSDVMAGRMCIKNGPYLMIPILGPSTARNAFGLVVDKFIFDPFSLIIPFHVTAVRLGLEIVSTKSEKGAIMRQISEDSIDDYAMLRSLYYQSDYTKEFKTYDSSKK